MAGKVYETAIEIGAKISKAFKSDTLGAALALTKLTDASKKLKQAEKSAAAYKKLDEAVRRSKGRYDQASHALRRLEQAERAAGGATKESTKWRKAGERELAKAAREMDRATKAAEKNAEALRKLGLSTNSLANDQKRLSHAAAFSSARERIFGAKKDPKDAVPLMQQAKSQVRGLASEAMMLGTAALGAGAAMAGLVTKAIHAGDEIGDTAEKLGVGVVALQELRYGAKQSGAETQDLDKALGKMLVTVGRFKAAKGKPGDSSVSLGGMQMLGTGGADSQGGETDPFKRMGLSAKKLASMKPEDQLKQIADGMKKFKTHADQAAVAQAVFGKGGLALLPFLKKGSAGIDELAKKGHKFGGIMSDKAVRAAGEADEAFNDMQMAINGVSTTLGAALLPTATKVFTQVATWVGDNRAQIQLWATNAATWIEGKGIPALLKIGVGIQNVASKALALVEAGARLTGGFGNLALVLGGLRLAPLAITLGKIGFQGTKAAIALVRLGATFAPMMAPLLAAAAPLLAVAAAATAVGVAVYKIVEAVKELGGMGAAWNDVKDFVLDKGPAVSKGNAGFAEMQAQNARNLELARARQAANGGVPIRASSTGGGLTVAPTISLVGGDRLEAGRQIDKAFAQVKTQALDAIDKRDAQRRRLAFSE